MRLRSKVEPWSGVVGGGLTLVDDSGVTRFSLAVHGTRSGITKEQSDEICRQLDEMINESGVELP